jgi:hypothetical protein
MANKKKIKNAPRYHAGTVVLAGDAFVAHSEVFTKQLFGKEINPPPQLTVQFLGELIASATTLSLGLELYLKALRTQAELPIPRTHHLLSLYNDLPHDMRAAVEAQYEKTKPSIGNGKTIEFILEIECGPAFSEVIKEENDKTSNPPRDHSLKSILERSSDAFVTWRYLHEGGQEGELRTYSYEFGCLNAAAKSLRTIVELIAISRPNKT